MTADLLQLAREALEDDKRATPGPWKWWTSNSFRRLSAVADGDVAYAFMSRSDGHPDIAIQDKDMKLIERARTREPLLAAEVARLTECLAKANSNHETFERLWYLTQDECEAVQADRDQLQAECESLKGQSEFCRHVMESLAAQLVAMTAARNELAQIADDRKLTGRVSLRTQQEDIRIAECRAVGGKETT